jgi:UDP-2,3-diacylglucosamine pyrophosphatase LpxH
MITHRRLIVISDLHLGGEEPAPMRVNGQAKGSRINSSYEELSQFIDWVASDPRPTEMILNGDIIDFLLDFEGSVGKTFIECPKEACERLERIAKDCGAFEAWGRLIRTGRHRLTLLLGNHDVELSFPEVRDRFAKLLGVGTHQIEFVVDGEAVTRGNVLIEHGNRYDPWNWIDHDGLRHERALQSRGVDRGTLKTDGRFRAPRGTHLVIELMNKLKSRYRFIDLLKPETGAALPIVLKIVPKLKEAARLLAGTRTLLAHHAVDLWRQDRSTKASTNPREIAAMHSSSELDDLDALMATIPEVEWTKGTSREGGLGQIDDLVRSNIEDLVKTCKNSWVRAAGVKEAFVAWWVKKANLNDISFEYDQEIDPYLTAAKSLMKGGFKVVIFGHTHLPKSIELECGARYLNTGTWVDIMRIDHLGEIDSELMETICSDIEQNRIEKYLRRYLSFAEVEFDVNGEATSGDVFSFCGTASPKNKILEAMK